MTSIISSDISLSTRCFNGRVGSAASAVGRLTDAKRVTQLSAVIGNGARDSALQINGPVTDKINNLNFKYLIIPCNCEIMRAVASTRVAPTLPAATPIKPRLSAPLKRSTYVNSVGPAETLSLLEKKRNITVFSKATGQPDTFCIVFPQRVRDSFISLKTVKRLGYRTQFDTAVVSSIMWNSKRLSSTGYLDLSFPMPGSDKSVARRLYVVEDCPFDMLLGTALTDLPHG